MTEFPDLEVVARACQAAAAAFSAFGLRTAEGGDVVLDEVNRQSRRRFVRCLGCDVCADPLPVLAGDVS